MNIIARNFLRRSAPRWLASAIVATGLMIPLSASAEHGRNQGLELLASAAITYAPVDVFDGVDDDRHHRRYKNHGYRHDRRGYRHDRYYRSDRHHRRDRHYRNNRHYRNDHYWGHGAERHDRRHGYRNDRYGYRNKHRN